MRFRLLGNTGLVVSEIGFGCWGIGGNVGHSSLGPTDDAVSRAAIDRALELGINLFDTADVYGAGHSERLLGDALGSARDRVVLATKGGYDFTREPRVHRFTRDYLRAAVSRSLERLRTDHVELYQLHNPWTQVLADPDVIGVMEELRAQGLFRFWGVSINTVEEAYAAMNAKALGMKVIQAIANVATQDVAYGSFREAQARGVGIFAREVLAQGLLAGRHAYGHTFNPTDARSHFPADRLNFLIGTAHQLRRYFSGRRPESVAQLATKFVLQLAGVTSVLLGMKTPAQVEENARIADLPDLEPPLLDWLREYR